MSLLSVLSVFVLASIATASNACPSSQPCERYSIQFYFKANWQRASQYCGSQGMRLASIFNEADQQTLAYQIADLGLQNQEFWVSGNSLLAAQGKFTWANGRPVTYTNWAVGEPSGTGKDGVEECIIVKFLDQTWNDDSCKKEFYFVCEHV